MLNRRRASAIPAFNVERLVDASDVRSTTDMKNRRSSIDILASKIKSKFFHHKSASALNAAEVEEDEESLPSDYFPQTPRYSNPTADPWVPRKDKRSQSLTVVNSIPFRASSSSALNGDVDGGGDPRASASTPPPLRNPRKDSREYYRRRASHHYCTSTIPMQQQPEYEMPRSSSMEEIQKKIYKAKAEAKTVSVVDGYLYINYEFVGPLPDGCTV